MLCSVIKTDLKMRCHDLFGEVISGSLEIRTGPLITVYTHTDTKPTVANLKAAGFKISFDWTKYARTPGCWYCLPIRSTSSDQSLTPSPLQGLTLQAVPGVTKGRFRRVGTFYSYNEENFTIDHALEDPVCWADESVYKGTAGVNSSGKTEYYITLF